MKSILLSTISITAAGVDIRYVTFTNASRRRSPHGSPILMRAHGGESIDMLAARVRDALQRCLACDVERRVVVTHAIVVKTAIALVRDEPLEVVFRMDIAPLSSTRFVHGANSGWSIHR